MANYKSNKGKTFLSVLAVILALLLIASVVLGIGDHFYGWFENTDEETEQTDEANYDGMVVSAVAARGITLSLDNAKSTTAATVNTSSSTYTVTATITPSTADNQNVTMSVAWANADSDWASGKTVTNYVTVEQTSTGSLTGTVTCKQAFGEQVILTVTSSENSDITAEATIDYVKRVSVAFSMSPSSFYIGTANTYTITPTYGVGTLTGDLTIGALTITAVDDFYTLLVTELNKYMSGDYTLSSGAAVIASSPVSGSSYTFDGMFGFSYDGAQTDDWAESIYYSSCYSVLRAMDETDNYTYTATIRLAYTYVYGDTTITNSSISKTVIMNYSGALTTVESVTLSYDSIIF